MYVTLKKLAQELGLDPSNMRKYVLGAGFDPVKIRTPESRKQLTLALTEEDAEAVRELREEQGFLSIERPVNDNEGWFYMVQLVPDLKPDRIKLGFAGDAQNRLKTYHTSAPTAVLLGSWPCRRTWEKAAMDCAVAEGCVLVANEVFDCEDIQTVMARCNQFFDLMPVMRKGWVPLSEV